MYSLAKLCTCSALNCPLCTPATWANAIPLMLTLNTKYYFQVTPFTILWLKSERLAFQCEHSRKIQVLGAKCEGVQGDV